MTSPKKSVRKYTPRTDRIPIEVARFNRPGSRLSRLANVLHYRAMDFVLTDHAEREAQRRQIPMD